jgi:hypothetical protein
MLKFASSYAYGQKRDCDVTLSLNEYGIVATVLAVAVIVANDNDGDDGEC